ncbi:hypothetical protein ABPG72_009849 [Tetrahymena utriculariae]
MKNQRSSTLSSPYDSYMYSQDSIEINPIQINSYKIDDSPFQKLRGFSQKPQNRSNIDPNSILNTSPFIESKSLVGIPISYLNLSNHSSQSNNILSENIKQSQDAQQKFIQGQLAQSQILLPQSKQILRDNKNMNKYEQSSNLNKIEDSGSPTDKNSGFDTGTFGGSAREDTFNLQISHRANSQDVTKSHNTQSYESPYSKNISTDYKTNQSFVNENQGSIDKSKLNSTHLSYFSPSPLKQPKQSIALNQKDKQQQQSIEYKLSSPYQDKIQLKQTDNLQVNQDLQSKDYSNVSKQQINCVQNENIIIPKVQSSEPVKKNQSLSYALNGISKNSNQNSSFAIQNNSVANLLNQNTQKNNMNSQSRLQINKYKNIVDNYNQYNDQNTTTNNSLQIKNSFKEIKKQQNIQDNNFNQKDSQISNQVEQNQSQSNLSQLTFKKQLTFQKQQTLDNNDSKDISQNINLSQQPQKIQAQLYKFQNSNKEFNPTAMITNISEHFTTNQSALTPQKQQQEIPQNSMNEFYEQMFQQNEEQGNQYNTNKQRNNDLYIYIDNEEEKYEESKKYTSSNQRIHSQQDDFRLSSGLIVLDKLNTSLKESEKQNQDKKIDILKLQSERDNLKEFIKNMETRNNLLNERIHLLEANLQSLNTQNMENIEKIVSLNKQLSEQDNNFQKKEKSTKNEQNQHQKDLFDAAQRQSVLQSEIQKLIQRDLDQEKKIVELTNKLNTLQQVRNDYEKSIKEQEIFVKNNQNSIQIIETQKVEIQKLQNLLQTKNQQPQSKLTQEKNEEDKKKLENECQKLIERNKNLEEHLSTMKTSCQKLEQAMAANCNSTQGWLEKYNKLEKSYLNLQNQFRAEQQKQIMEKNIASKKELMSNRSQQSFNRFRSELSEQEIKIQFQRNQELIRAEVQNERDELDYQNQQLIQKITEIQNQNSQLEQQVQNLIQNNKKQFEENEIQKKDLLSKLNIMINENNKLVDAYNERPILIQKIQELSQQNLDHIKQFRDNSTPFITQFSNIESSGISVQPPSQFNSPPSQFNSPPSQFNSPQEEIKWYRLKCNQLEVKLKVKSEECAELIYQNKLLKKQSKGNNLEELTIKSSLYQTFQQSPNSNLIKQPGKFHSEIVCNANKQNVIQEEKEDNRGFCEKLCQNNKDKNNNKNNNHDDDQDIDSETGRESLACNVKCL